MKINLKIITPEKEIESKILQSIVKHINNKINPTVIQGIESKARGLIKEALQNSEGASEIISDVTVSPGFVCGSSYDFFSRDISRADRLLKALGPEDIGQGVVVENGLVLGIETLQGTNELLSFVEQTASHLRINGMGGIFVKRPKADQDLRFDMPVVGPKTVELACKAGLSGLVISPGSVMLLERQRCIEIAEAYNFFILAEESLV